MYRRFLFENRRISFVMGMIFIITFSVGSMCSATMDAQKCMEVKEYFLSFFESLGNLEPKSVALGSLKSIGISFIIMFVSAFFKAGSVFNVLVVIKQAYVTGFTFSAFLKIFGRKGFLIDLAMLPENIILIPILLIFSSYSTKMALVLKNSEKKFLLLFVFFSIICAGIFCGYAFLNGYVTTRFMKWVIF